MRISKKLHQGSLLLLTKESMTSLNWQVMCSLKLTKWYKTNWIKWKTWIFTLNLLAHFCTKFTFSTDKWWRICHRHENMYSAYKLSSSDASPHQDDAAGPGCCSSKWCLGNTRSRTAMLVTPMALMRWRVKWSLGRVIYVGKCCLKIQLKTHKSNFSGGFSIFGCSWIVNVILHTADIGKCKSVRRTTQMPLCNYAISIQIFSVTLNILISASYKGLT